MFLLMLAISLGAYYFWIEQTVFSPFANDDEKDWYEGRSITELADLASAIAKAGTDSVLAAKLVSDYGASIRQFNTVLVVFGPDGYPRFAANHDSVEVEIDRVSVELLHDMTDEDWDFSTFPEPTDMHSYENLIFAVDLIPVTPGHPHEEYLASSFGPTTILSEDLNNDAQLMGLQITIMKSLVGLLIYSAVTALLIMAWTSRRIQRLSAGVAAFAEGDFSRRVRARSTDEIGVLARNFNDMAAHIESMVAELTTKERFQRQLIANISHDLRTPMASMRGYVETLLMDDNQLPREQKDRYLKIITGNLDHLNRLVEHMLTLSRFDSGQTAFQLENFPIGELADSVLLRFEGLAAQREISLDLALAEGVGLVHADPLQISQVLQNLLENAVKFNRPGGSVVIEITRRDQRTNIEIRDTGYGIPPEDLPHIFDRFYTVNKSRTRSLGGTGPDQLASALGQNSGLGLAIASRIITEHGGNLRVSSRLGAGTTFEFTLDHSREDFRKLAAGA